MSQHRREVVVVDGPFEVPGVALGHWTHPEGVTGCTVLLADRLSPCTVDVRGGAPGTRETDLLGPGRSVQAVDAILLTGGSAFGLSAADGVVRWLRERERGFPTGSINVPIVPGAVIFDLVGVDPPWPGADAGYEAVAAATETWHSGRHGAGAGARVSKALGRDQAVPSGVGVAQVRTPAGTVSAVFVNNAFGDVVDVEDGRLLTTPGGHGLPSESILLDGENEFGESPNTVIGVISVDRPLDHDALTRITIAGQGGVARVIRPAHSPLDGDTVFALAPELGTCTSQELMQLTVATQIASARAIINSVRLGI